MKTPQNVLKMSVNPDTTRETTTQLIGCLHEAIVGATVGATGCGNYANYSQSRRTA